ncbi:hypothetical protein [Salisediminibacterium beveridgei]|nr:hypothetical protein [Salisediminibacterium beveridgei]
MKLVADILIACVTGDDTRGMSAVRQSTFAKRVNSTMNAIKALRKDDRHG